MSTIDSRMLIAQPFWIWTGCMGRHDCVRTMQTVSEDFTLLPVSELCKLCPKVANWVRIGMQTMSDRYFWRILDQNSSCKLCQNVANYVRHLQTMSDTCKLCPRFANYVRHMQTVSEIAGKMFQLVTQHINTFVAFLIKFWWLLIWNDNTFCYIFAKSSTLHDLIRTLHEYYFSKFLKQKRRIFGV